MSEEKKTEFTEEELKAQIDELEKKEKAEAKKGEAKITTIAEEEKKGKEPLKLTPDQMRQIAVMNHTQGITSIQHNILKLSKKNIMRILIALLQLPHRDNAMPSKIRDPLAKQLFIIGQQVLSAKFALLQEYVISQAKAERAEKKEAEEKARDDVKNEQVPEVKEKSIKKEEKENDGKKE